ncbi:MAG: cadmium-translocating P-type ATPase [Clostridia bacterium]|nr:cadmium-translocating P-type ATPase [Clostridia bacterium]
MSRKQKKMLARIITAAVLWAVAMLAPTKGIFVLALFLVPYAVIGYDVLWGALRNILHGQVFDEKFLMAIATVGAFAIGDYKEACAVMLFYQVGEFFQSVAVGKSRKNIAALMDICPDFAVVLRDGGEETVPPDEVAIGETIVVRPGEKIPLDGIILKGSTSVNTSALTGESVPQDKTVGERVISGSINLTGAIEMRTESAYEESTVAKILELVENSSEKKARVESFITRFARWYTPCVVIGAAFLAVVPSLITGHWAEWIHRALVFLVVSCPCALVVSVPLSFFGGIGGASREGVLIKGANYLEALAGVDTVVFDKTGTLTKGSFDVSAVHASGIAAEELLSIAAVAESFSVHPVAQSIVAAYKGEIDKKRAGEVKEIAGMGLEAAIDGEKYYLGNTALMEKIGAKAEICELAGTSVHIAKYGLYLGHIIINDKIKDESARALKALKALGIKKTVMLTGDGESVAKAVGANIGIDEVRAGLLPANKVEEVERLLSGGAHIAFVGDGINDAPVLSRADVGIAMGALGSDAAIESADIVLMDDNPEKIAFAIKTARKTMRIVRQNIAFALGVKGIILVLGAVGIANMWLAVFGDVGVMVIAILNAMRAMRKER